MFSSRLGWDLSPNPLTRLIEGKRASGERILDLTESNPTSAGLDYPSQQILTALSAPLALRYSPGAAGLLAARMAVATYYGQRVSPGRVLLTASTSEAYGFLFKLLANPADEVLVPRPSYPLFDYLAALESVKVVLYPLIYDHGWMIDFGTLEQLITPRARAIVIVNPNNPTGSFLKRHELARLSSICRRRGLAIISDEVFADYAFGPDPNRVESLVDISGVLAFSLSGLSKISGLPQMKLAWIVVSGPDELRAQAYSRLELIADTYLSVSTPVQIAAAALLETRETIQGQIKRRTAANLATLRARIRSTPFDVLDLEGGWYAILQAPLIRTEEEWVLELLGRHNTLVQPGFFYDFDHEAFLILSLLTPEPIFNEGLDRLLSLA